MARKATPMDKSLAFTNPNLACALFEAVLVAGCSDVCVCVPGSRALGLEFSSI